MKGKTLLCLALVISILLGVFMIGPVSAQPTTIGVEPASIVDPGLVPGSIFTVEIWVRGVEDLAGLEFKLGYDTAVLTATALEYGDIFGDTYFPLISEIYDADGYLHYSIMESFGEPGFYGDGRAAIITFSVDSEGESVLDLYDTKLGDSSPIPVPIVHDALDGYFSNVAAVQYTLTVAVVGSGTTDPAPGDYVYDAGTVVSVDAIPDAGWMLDHWELDTVDVGAADPYSVTMNMDHALTAFFVEIPAVRARSTLARRSAWPEHHHYSIGKDEDSSNDLFAIVSNDGDMDTWVKVVFSVTDSGGNLIGDWETDPILLPVGGMYGHKADARYKTAFVPPSVGKYYVSAVCWVDTEGDTVPDTPMGKIKTFSFNVVS